MLPVREAILGFAKQLEFQPEIKNGGSFFPAKKIIVVGMGGSHLAGDLLKIFAPNVDVIIHEDYGLPDLPEEELKDRLIVLSSYSGNTEEILDAFRMAQNKQLNMIAIAIGGKLLAVAQENGVAHVQLPDLGLEPRMALGFSLTAILKICGAENVLAEILNFGGDFNPGACEERGQEIAAILNGKVPVIYSSRRNFPLAYIWKIKFNETSKIPAFANFLPEQNHNEMTGFDVVDATRALSEKFYFILLKDSADDSRVQKRMDVLEKMYKARGLEVLTINLGGQTVSEKIFNALILGDWASYHLGSSYGVETADVPMVEEFKRLISNS